MKKSGLFYGILLAMFCTSCSSEDAPTEQAERQLMENNWGVTGNTPAIQHDVEEEEHVYVPVEGIDLDLTQLSSTMVFSEVYQMMFYPEEYVGKTIRMFGQFLVYQDQQTEELYFACVVQDALACCAQGIEFILKDGVYPYDYPEPGSFVMITGEFATYEEYGYTMIHLINAETW